MSGNWALRISVIGRSGAGKSTCADLITQFGARRGLDTVRLRLADPLYRLQAKVYASAGRTPAPGAQDQVLMEDLAGHLRRVNQRALIDDFLTRMLQVETAGGRGILLNDDLRDPHVDTPELRSAGFRILRISCQEEIRQMRLKERGDLTRSDNSTRQLNLIPVDAVVHNNGDLEEYRTNVTRVLEGWT